MLAGDLQPEVRLTERAGGVEGEGMLVEDAVMSSETLQVLVKPVEHVSPMYWLQVLC